LGLGLSFLHPDALRKAEMIRMAEVIGLMPRHLYIEKGSAINRSQSMKGRNHDSEYY
jgi:hypothetical protein